MSDPTITLTANQLAWTLAIVVGKTVAATDDKALLFAEENWEMYLTTASVVVANSDAWFTAAGDSLNAEVVV